MTKKLLANCRFDFISTLSVNKTLKHVGSNPHRNFEAASFLIPIDISSVHNGSLLWTLDFSLSISQ